MFRNVGNDSDGFVGAIIGIMIVFTAIIMIVAIFCYAGAFIGGIKAIINYCKSFKHNVIDPNVVSA